MRMLSIIVLIAASMLQPARAEVVLMVHGFLGDASSWERSFVSQALDSHDHRHAGRFVAGPNGPTLMVPKGRELKHTGVSVYLAELPSIMPATVQSDLLQHMLQQLQAIHAEESITIVGHSAGGVIARLTLVRFGAGKVRRLVTIASPHLGTSRAVQALGLTSDHGPFNMAKSFFGGSEYDALRRSRVLLHELAGTYPGSMLAWLNQQPHPDIEYVSVLRTRPDGAVGDDIVPGYSQDMNRVDALRGKSSVIMTPAGHALNVQDAELIMGLLQARAD